MKVLRVSQTRRSASAGSIGATPTISHVASGDIPARAGRRRLLAFLLGNLLANIFNIDLKAAVLSSEFIDVLDGHATGGRTFVQRSLLLQLGDVHVNSVETTLLRPELRDELFVPSLLMDDQSCVRETGE